MKKNSIIIALFLITIMFITVGFAVYNQTLEFGGSAILEPSGYIYISNVQVVSLRNASVNDGIVFTDNSIDFNLSFTTTTQQASASDYEAVIEITMTNESFYDCIYTVPDYPVRINGESDGKEYDPSLLQYVVSGINTGDRIPSNTDKTFTVTITFTNPLVSSTETFVINGDFAPSMTEDTISTLIASVDSSVTGDLRGNNQSAAFSISVVNTYPIPKTITFEIDKDNFVIQDSNNNSPVEYTIDANTEETINIYILKANNASFKSSIERINIYMNSAGHGRTNIGRVNVLVDQNTNYEDTTAPYISNVTVDIKNETGSVQVSWQGEDDVWVKNYKIIAFRENQSQGEVTLTVTGNEQTVNFTNLSAASYYFTVYGIDGSDNQATDLEISRATTARGHASRSALTELKWQFTIQFNLTNFNAKSNTTAQRGDTYTTTLTPNNGYDLPDRITVTMNNANTNLYTYNSTSGAVSVGPITGNVRITATAPQHQNTCLVAGTKILLANGKYKNIEDIEYTDLLAVYNHINGEMTSVYPVWIEEDGIANKYERISFSDGSILEVVNRHALFDVDKRKYVDVSNSEEFNIGTRVYKIYENELNIVSVTNIEYIDQEMRFYNVISSGYYNIIANDFITTDPTTSFSNLYGFEENAVYSDNYNRISQGEHLEYKDVSFIPRFLYNGLNLKNALELLGNSIDINNISKIIEKQTISPIVKNGKLCFIVTTSQDDVTSENVEQFLYEEGCEYKVPKTDAKYFIDTSTMDKYYEGDTIIVYNSMHLMAVW